jgi:hypothetical protein
MNLGIRKHPLSVLGGEAADVIGMEVRGQDDVDFFRRIACATDPNLRSRRPLPGQPLGNMENSRCREGLNDKVREGAAQSNPQKPGLGSTSFEGATVR